MKSAMEKNSGLRAIFIILWTVGSIFWVLIGALDGDFIRSVIVIAVGWAILFSFLGVKDALARRRDAQTESEEG